MSTTPPPFAPVPVRARRDGWTPERQVAFITALAESRSVSTAARIVGLRRQTAYRLRQRRDAAGFAAAWDAALAPRPVPPDYTGRALGGVARPITYRGRQVGERRTFDNRLAMFLVQRRRPDRFGPGVPHVSAVVERPGGSRPARSADAPRPEDPRFAGDVSRTLSPSKEAAAASGHRRGVPHSPPVTRPPRPATGSP